MFSNLLFNETRAALSENSLLEELSHMTKYLRASLVSAYASSSNVSVMKNGASGINVSLHFSDATMLYFDLLVWSEMSFLEISKYMPYLCGELSPNGTISIQIAIIRIQNLNIIIRVRHCVPFRLLVKNKIDKTRCSFRF